MNRNYPEARRNIQKSLRRLGEQSPTVMTSLGLLHGATYAPGALEPKHKELIALGISIGVRCDDCIAFHIHEALAQGATHDEVIETLNVAIQMGGGPSVMYATHALEALEQFSNPA